MPIPPLTHLPPRRPQDHRGRRDRVREEPARRDHPDGVLAVGVCVARPADLHGRPHPEVHQEVRLYERELYLGGSRTLL